MKAIVLREFGPPETLKLEEMPTPEPGPGEVLIEVHAVSVNRTLDLVVRSGKYAIPVKLPHVLGVDPSGIVAAVGDGVTTRKLGDRVATWPILHPPGSAKGLTVLGIQVWGGYAEYVRLPAAATFIVPNGLDFPTATIVARHAPHAFNLLRDVGRLGPGETLLVMGASGGLGHAGVQVAKHLGARVIAAAGSAAGVAAALKVGADAGIDYRAQDLTAEALRLTGGKGVDAVFENIGDPELFPKAFLSLAANGRLITSGGHGGGIVPLDVSRLYLRNLSVLGSHGRLVPGDMETSLALAATGRFHVLIDHVLPLAEAAHAHAIVGGRSGLGKVVLQPTAG